MQRVLSRAILCGVLAALVISPAFAERSGLQMRTAPPEASLPQAVVPYASAGAVIYICDSAGYLWTLTLGTYKLRRLGNAGVVLTDIAFDPKDGKLWGVSYSSFYTIDVTSGKATFFGSTALGDITGLVFDTNGIGYFEGDASNVLYAVNLTARTYKTLGATGSYKCAGDLTFYEGSLVLAGFSGPFTTATKETLVQLNSSNGKVLATAATDLTQLIALATVGGKTLYGFADTSIYLLLPNEKTVRARTKLLKNLYSEGLTNQVFGAAYKGDD